MRVPIALSTHRQIATHCESYVSAVIRIDPKQNSGVLRVAGGRLQLHFPTISRANEIGTNDPCIWPVKKFQRQIFISNGRAADRLIELRNLFRARALDFLKARIISAESQLQGLVRITEDVANNRPVLHEVKWHDFRVLPELSTQIDLLLRLTQANVRQ